MKCSYEHNVPTTNINKDENAEKIELLENTVKIGTNILDFSYGKL